MRGFVDARLLAVGAVRCARRRDWFDGIGHFFGSWSRREQGVRAPAEMKKSSNSASRWKRKGMLAAAAEAKDRSVENVAGRRGV
jgi:hypothetical protein